MPVCSMKLSRNPIPDSYGLLKQGRTTVVLSKHYLKRMIQLGIAHPDRLFDTAPLMGEDCRGRSAVKALTIPGHVDERIVIRQYRRGGPIQKFVSDLYWGKSRPLHELWLTWQARKRGVSTVEIVAACHTTVFWKLHRGHLVSKEIKNGKDFYSYLEHKGQTLSRAQVQEKRKVITSIAVMVRKMHDAGIFHADLNLKNIIVQPEESGPQRIYLIDFDKSTIQNRLSERKRRQNLMRLNRSAEKFKAQGLPLTRTDVLRFLHAYYHQDSHSFKKTFRDLSRQYSRHIYLHRLGAKMLSLLA